MIAIPRLFLTWKSSKSTSVSVLFLSARTVLCLQKLDASSNGLAVLACKLPQTIHFVHQITYDSQYSILTSSNGRICMYTTFYAISSLDLEALLSHQRA